MAEMEGFTVVDPSTVLITHLTEFIKSYAHEILSRQDVQDLLDTVKENNEALVNELVPNHCWWVTCKKSSRRCSKKRFPYVIWKQFWRPWPMLHVTLPILII